MSLLALLSSLSGTLMCSVWNAVPLPGHLWIPLEAALGVRLLAVDRGRPYEGLVFGLVDRD